MALQFDGVGYVSLPDFTLSGDFTISGEYEYTGATEILIGLEGSTANFIAVFPDKLQARIAGDNVFLESASFSEGSRYSYTISRSGGTLTIAVAGLGSNSGAASSDFPLNALGRYSGSGLRYTGAMYGELVITNATVNRTYDFNQSSGSSTLPDTQSNQDGTLTDFSSGGFFVATEPANNPPVANAGADQSNIAAGSTVTLDGSASSDPDNDTLTYAWTQTGGDDTVTLAGANTATPSFTAPASAQTLTFELIVNDGEASSSPSTVNVGVAEAVSSDSYDVILLVGQSNMVGRRGPIDPVLDATDSRIMQYGTNNKVVEIAEDPLDHWDAGADTIGLGLTLAKNYADNHLESGRKVLLVPAAKGGTSFTGGFWDVGGDGYNNAIARANEALALNPANKLVLMAWHQGESDAARTEAEYTSYLDTLIADFRSNISGASDVPFIVGEVPTTSSAYGAGVAAALSGTPSRVSESAYVETSDLELSGDGIHFIGASLRALGLRYSDAYSALVNPLPIVNAGSDISPTVNVPVTLSSASASNYTSLSWSCTSGQSPTFSNSAILNPVVTFNEAGGHTLQLTATNVEGSESDTLTATVQAEQSNIPPTANAGIDQSVAAGVTVQLDGTGSTDGDGTIVSYSWAQTAGDAVILTGASTSTPSFTAPSTNAQQTLTFELTVTDNDTQTDTDAVDITVEAEVVQPIESTLNLTVSGITAGLQALKLWSETDDSIVFNSTAMFTDEAAAITLSVPAGTVITGRWLGTNPPTTGTGVYGVTV